MQGGFYGTNYNCNIVMLSCLVQEIWAQAKPLIGIERSSSSQKDTSQGPKILTVGFMGLTTTAV